MILFSCLPRNTAPKPTAIGSFADEVVIKKNVSGLGLDPLRCWKVCFDEEPFDGHNHKHETDASRAFDLWVHAKRLVRRTVDPSGRFKDHWRAGQSVPDVSQPETKLWFYFLGASFADLGCEAIHLGQTELRNKNDPNLDHYSQGLALIRAYAAKQ